MDIIFTGNAEMIFSLFIFLPLMLLACNIRLFPEKGSDFYWTGEWFQLELWGFYQFSGLFLNGINERIFKG